MMRLGKLFWAYLVCGTLFFIWQTSNSLAIYYMPALTEILYSVFAAHYVAGGIGIIAAGLLCDKIIRADKSRRLFAAAAMLLLLAALFIKPVAQSNIKPRGRLLRARTYVYRKRRWAYVA